MNEKFSLWKSFLVLLSCHVAVVIVFIVGLFLYFWIDSDNPRIICRKNCGNTWNYNDSDLLQNCLRSCDEIHELAK